MKFRKTKPPPPVFIIRRIGTVKSSADTLIVAAPRSLPVPKCYDALKPEVRSGNKALTTQTADGEVMPITVVPLLEDGAFPVYVDYRETPQPEGKVELRPIRIVVELDAEQCRLLEEVMWYQEPPDLIA